MNRFFTGYGALVMMAFAMATHQGYAWSALFANARHTTAAENHYHK